jgi:hypothetical protein
MQQAKTNTKNVQGMGEQGHTSLATGTHTTEEHKLHGHARTHPPRPVKAFATRRSMAGASGTERGKGGGGDHVQGIQLGRIQTGNGWRQVAGITPLTAEPLHADRGSLP